VAMAVPTPNATARAPTRPTKLLYCMTHDPKCSGRSPSCAVMRTGEFGETINGLTSSSV
jgi:hypothetical protein